jgi:hypothetical protein
MGTNGKWIQKEGCEEHTNEDVLVIEEYVTTKKNRKV